MLSLNPATRPSTSELREHPWIVQGREILEQLRQLELTTTYPAPIVSKEVLYEAMISPAGIKAIKYGRSGAPHSTILRFCPSCGVLSWNSKAERHIRRSALTDEATMTQTSHQRQIGKHRQSEPGVPPALHKAKEFATLNRTSIFQSFSPREIWKSLRHGFGEKVTRPKSCSNSDVSKSLCGQLHAVNCVKLSDIHGMMEGAKTTVFLRFKALSKSATWEQSCLSFVLTDRSLDLELESPQMCRGFTDLMRDLLTQHSKVDWFQPSMEPEP